MRPEGRGGEHIFYTKTRDSFFYAALSFRRPGVRHEQCQVFHADAPSD